MPRAIESRTNRNGHEVTDGHCLVVGNRPDPAGVPYVFPIPLPCEVSHAFGRSRVELREQGNDLLLPREIVSLRFGMNVDDRAVRVRALALAIEPAPLTRPDFGDG